MRGLRSFYLATLFSSAGRYTMTVSTVEDIIFGWEDMSCMTDDLALGPRI